MGFSCYMGNRLLRNLAFGLFALVTFILMIATVVEKIKGSDFVQEYIYGSLWMVVLWGVAAHFALFFIIKQKLYKRFAIFAIHVSFLIIIVGAYVTYKYGVQGRVHLCEGDAPVNAFALDDAGVGHFPFSLKLKNFDLQYYDGTFAPMDYVSNIVILDADKAHEGVVSMNNIFKYRGYRFYQSGYDKDGKGATLSVAYDPYGIAITYTGYLCLLISMLAFFFQRFSTFKLLLRHPSIQKGVLCIVATASFLSASAMPRTLPQSVAEKFCDLSIYYNERVCPLQTFAIDFTTKLCGRSSYAGLSAEQVLTGWFFFYDDWKNEPIIKIKGGAVRHILGVNGSYARLVDFIDHNGYKLEAALSSTDATLRRNAESANEKFNLISMLCTGSLLKIYPYADVERGTIRWYSFSDKLPHDAPYEQWLFISNSMSLVAEQVAKKDWARVGLLLDKINKYQQREAAGYIPDKALRQAEKIYNTTNYNRFLAIFCVVAGLIFSLLNGRKLGQNRLLQKILQTGLFSISIYLAIRIVLRGFIGGYMPLSNGFETMQFMALCSVILTFLCGKYFRLSLPFGYLLCGLTMLVAMMGEASPKITHLMPVLQSPLLSIHVVVIMLAYTLFAFMMLNGLSALIMYLKNSKKYNDKIENLTVTNRIMLYPALFLLTIGIFVGAVWANVSWGRYWGWDPKEVWALITMLIYSAALHSRSLRCLKKPLAFNIYCVVAFVTVLITYFGVNFILGGMHGYA